MDAPQLSVIIATHNRKALLLRCLEALHSQTVPPEVFEVVVIDDGSTDDTAGALQQLDPPFRMRVLRVEKTGQAGAQNAGIAVAQGGLCLILDDDVIASPELMAVHLAAHREEPRIVGIGKITQKPPDARDWYARAYARGWNRHYEHLASSDPDYTAIYGANLSVGRSALQAVGGFTNAPDRGLDDVELGFRLWRSGLKPRYLPDAHVVHEDPKRGDRLLADTRRDGAGSVELSRSTPEMMPKLLGWFAATSQREIALRRLMIALHVRPGLLARLGPFIPGRGHEDKWFDFVSRLAFWRGVRQTVSRKYWTQLTYGVPVLMYHAFGETEGSDRYVISRRAFERQIRLLRLLGRRVIEFERIGIALREDQLLPARAVAITIDDGYADNLQLAHPVLARRSLPATIFLVSGRIGARNDWSSGDALAERRLLDDHQIAQLAGARVSFGAHSRTHCSLRDIPDAQVEPEIQGSRGDLERRLGVPITTFAYPFGRYDERALSAVRNGGFTCACTVEPRLVGPSDDPLTIPRIEVKASDSLVRFAIKLWFGGA